MSEFFGKLLNFADKDKDWWDTFWWHLKGLLVAFQHSAVQTGSQKYELGLNYRCCYYVVKYVLQRLYVRYQFEQNQQYFKTLFHASKSTKGAWRKCQGLQPVQLHSLDCQQRAGKFREIFLNVFTELVKVALPPRRCQLFGHLPCFNCCGFNVLIVIHVFFTLELKMCLLCSLNINQYNSLFNGIIRLDFSSFYSKNTLL